MDTRSRVFLTARWFKRNGLFVAAPVIVATYATARILTETGGQLAVPLDDAFIHFQYARSVATMAPLVYTPGQAPAPGATSPLWVLVLAPFWGLGLRQEWIICAAWLLGWISFGLLAFEAQKVSKPLTTHAGSLACFGACICFGAFIWCAASGMEIMPFAWLLLRTARRSSQWAELDANQPGRPKKRELLALAAATALMRPEGFISSLWIGLTLGIYGVGRARLWSLPAALTALVPSALNFIVTGQARTTSSMVKWLLFNPHYSVADSLAKSLENARFFYTSILDGGPYTATFVPEGGRFIAVLALPALLVAGYRTGHLFRACALAWVGAAILIPTTYESYLVNRLRYIWPFAAPWLIGLVALADSLGQLPTRWHPRWAVVGFILNGGLVVCLATRIVESANDLATSAGAILRQQMSLGRWARANLPKDSRIGLNDAGAIAYFSDRATFDIVGLTTAGEAEHWMAGPGSRFEHYERLKPEVRPTHFFVYRQWFDLDPLLGEFLTERHVPAATILGAPTMVAYRANYAPLNSATLPDSIGSVPIHDRLDVADLLSERQHEYEPSEATRIENRVFTLGDRVDGGRAGHQSERFVLDLVPDGLLVARLGAPVPMQLGVFVGKERVATWSLSVAAWQQRVLRLPRSIKGAKARVAVVAQAGTQFSSLHYWVTEPPNP